MSTTPAAHIIEVYDGSSSPAPRPYRTERATTEQEARRVAARLLAHASLRGASSWPRPDGGTVWQFGPHREDNGFDYAVIVEVS